MRRREFITMLGSAVVWPAAARGQQPTMPVVGFFNGQSPIQFEHLVSAFHRGLNQTGYIEGRNVAIEYRWAQGDDSRAPELISDLISRQPALIVVTGSSRGPYVAKAATTTIPIVASVGADPVKSGLVASLNRPEGNITGTTVFSDLLEGKRLDLLHQLVPTTALIGVLVDPTFNAAEGQVSQVQEAARTRGYPIRVVNVSAESELESAFSTLREARAGAITVTGNPFFNSRRNHLIALAARTAIPAMYEVRQFIEAGGLMSYGPSITDIYRQVGFYAGRILKGEKPSELPVVQPTKFEFLINLNTAKALGLNIPPTVLALADEVIE
jgi:putative ABC transport system substrate-binding protein